MGNLCGAFCSTETAPQFQTVGGFKDEAFMTLILKAKVTKQGWQRSVARLLENCKEVKRVQMDESGRVEVSCIGNSDKVLKKIGRSRKLKHQWIQSGQCSSNLFIQESSSKVKQSPDGDRRDNYYNYPPHQMKMITAPAPAPAAGYGYGYGYGYGGYGNQYGYNGYGYPYPTQLTPYY